MSTTAEVTSLRYEFKSGPYSSHTLLLAEFPVRGDGLRVLDLGCASGHLAKILAERGFDVTGVDDGPGMLVPSSVRFVRADLEQGLPELEGQFDFILCADVLEHLRDPLRMLKECKSLLRPDGLLIGSLPNSGHLYFRLSVLAGRFPQDSRGLFDRTHLRFFTWHGWRQLLADGGFCVEALRHSAVPIGLALPRWKNVLAVRMLERLSFELARIWKTLFAYQFIVRARGV
jgi:SAM-dependent methyltransferase